jgi:hypothetical protein
MTAELKASEKSACYTFGDSVPASAKQLAPIRQLAATATTSIATFMASPLLEYLVERASAALAMRDEGKCEATSRGQIKSIRNQKLPLEGKDHVNEPTRSSAVHRARSS